MAAAAQAATPGEIAPCKDWLSAFPSAWRIVGQAAFRQHRQTADLAIV
jgi:hypothetical protein